MDSRPLRVVIAEDSALIREGIARLIEESGGTVVAKVGDGEAFVAAVEAERPDVSVVDVRMPPTQRDEGLRAAIEARRRVPGTPILVLSQYVERQYATELLADRAGGVGYLKDRVGDVREFMEALRRVANGGTALDPEVVAQLMARNHANDPLSTLTPRERHEEQPRVQKSAIDRQGHHPSSRTISRSIRARDHDPAILGAEPAGHRASWGGASPSRRSVAGRVAVRARPQSNCRTTLGGAMKAALRDRYGMVDVVELREVERPQPSGDQVLVRVRAASVNRADLDGIKPRPGFVRLFMGLRAPRQHRLGIDVAGEVEAIGPDVRQLRVGDRVFADLFSFGAGSFAEYVCASERAFLPIPPAMSFEAAATLPHSAVLGVQGLRLRSGRTIKAGDRVLVDGASGNVGPFAVQIAKSMGATVTGVARTEKLDFVRSLGADQVIDYTTTDYTKSGERYDWIVDTDSHHSLPAVRRALAPGGVYVTLGGTSWPILLSMVAAPILGRASGRSMGLLLWWKPFHRPDVERVLSLIAEGKLRPMVDRAFPLDLVIDALRWVDEGRARGKVLVIP